MEMSAKQGLLHVTLSISYANFVLLMSRPVIYLYMPIRLALLGLFHLNIICMLIIFSMAVKNALLDDIMKYGLTYFSILNVKISSSMIFCLLLFANATKY